MSKKKKGYTYSAAEKRAYYVGYGFGLAGHDMTGDPAQSLVLRQRSEKLQISMISGIIDAGIHRRGKKKK